MASVMHSHADSNNAAADALNDLRLFLAGTSSYDSKVRGSDVAKAAIRLLKTLPVAREAVLEYMHNLFDDAVNRHIMRLDSEETGVPVELEERDVAVEEVQRVLSGFIKSNLGAWAPIISSWSLELLGHLTRKYADRRIVHYSSSLPEVLQMWMACPPTRTLIDLTTQCLSTLIDTNPDKCIDTLLETSVQHSPHFDWVVAHIGSCFPHTVITRVLACGLKDFISHEDEAMGAVERNVPKLASVVGILGHLAGQHAADIRRVLVALMQESFAANPTREQLATIPFLLQLASMSEHLLNAVVSEFTKVLSADTLNKLSTLMGKWESAKIPGTRDLLSLTVVLIVQSGSGDLRFLSQILDIASGESEFSSALLPAVPNAAGMLLDSVLLEMQQRVFAGATEIPLLSALEARLPELCGWLQRTRCGPRTMWLWNVLSLICVHRKEKTTLTVLSHLLGRIRGSTELLFFQALIYQVEVVHVNCLTHTISHLMAELRSGRVPNPTQLVENLKKLSGNAQVGVRVSSTVCKFAEVLAEQMQLSSDLTYADAVAELLSTSVQPEAMSPTAVVKVAAAAVAYFFAIVCNPAHYGPSRKYTAACVCFRLLSTLCTRSVAQHLALRNLLSGALDNKVSWRFGSCPRRSTEVSLRRPRFVHLLDENQKFATSINFPQSHSSIVRVGVIGSGLRSVPPSPPIADEEVVLNKQLLLEAITACCALPWRNDRPSPTRTSPVGGMKIVALLLVEMISSDVMFNGLPWPDEDFLKVTIERDLHIQAMFVDHPILWDLLRLVASVRPSLCYCSVLLRAVMAVAMTHWRNCQEKAAASSPKHLETTRTVLRIMSLGQLLPPAMNSLGEVLPLLSPFEVFCVLSDVWQYMRNNVPSPALFTQKNPTTGELWREFKAPAADLKYMERLRAIMISNIQTCGLIFQKFFSVDT
ncbi:integrator complex subunit 5 isoform X1 [Dermacentor andersoni]|uniref:integrator complex subunit 5 isoform X1 n=1 Tax=Dermacentor andersoni TaxID=34620 RepID=UPI002155D62B|nr:integrator complex subunit 5-like isoform X1 [Dermacentor andersoni]